MKKNLVIICNDPQYIYKEKTHLFTTFAAQYEGLTKYFDKITIYSPFIQTYNSSTEGHLFSSKVEVEKLCNGMHKGKIGLLFSLIKYILSIRKVINENKKSLFLTYIPASYIGTIAAMMFKIYRVNSFYRVGSDVIKESKTREHSVIQRLLFKLLSTPYAVFTNILFRNELCFFSGESYMGNRKKHYKVNSSNLSLDDFYYRQPCKKKEYSVLYVGRFDVNKGVEYFLGSKKYTNSNVRYSIVGFGSTTDEDRINNLLESNILYNDVKKHGYIPFGPKLFHFFRSADVLVVPSLQEFAGKTHIEAMSQGCAVIATNVGGIPKFVIDGFNGILIEPKNEIEIARSIDYLIENYEYRKKMILNGYEFAAKYTLEKMNHFIYSKLIKHGKINELAQNG